MNRQEKRITKMVFKNLDNIFKSSKVIAKDWGTTTIPLSTLKIIIDKSKPSDKTGNEIVDSFNKQFCKTLDSLYTGCKEVSKKMNSKNISLSSLEFGINVIKTAFKDGRKISTSKAIG